MTGTCGGLRDLFPFPFPRIGVPRIIGWSLPRIISSSISFFFNHSRITDEADDFEARVAEMYLEFIEHGFEKENLICKFFSIC